MRPDCPRGSRVNRASSIKWCVHIAVGLALTLAGCGTTKQVPGAGPGAEYLVSCWHLGWYICYDKARQLCPDFKVLSENEDFEGRKVRIACPVAK